MQVDSIKPTLKAPGVKLLNLTYDKPLSNFAFKFNLRRYTVVKPMAGRRHRHQHGRPVQLDPIKPNLKPPGTERLKLKCDVLLSTFALKFNLCRYSMALHCIILYVPWLAVTFSVAPLTYKVGGGIENKNSIHVESTNLNRHELCHVSASV